MKALHKTAAALLTLILASATLADVARPVQQSSTTKALMDDLATGAKMMKISAAGNLTWESGATLTGASYFRTAAGLTIGADVQAYDADLTTYAGITPSANVQSLLGAADYAAMRTSLGLVIGTNVQAYDVDLTTYAGITPSANVQSLLGAADYAAMRTALGLVIGTNVQAYDGDLTTWAGITPGTGVGTALGNAVDGASGLLTYGMIGTSGARVPLLNAANTWSANQNVNGQVKIAVTSPGAGTENLVLQGYGKVLSIMYDGSTEAGYINGDAFVYPNYVGGGAGLSVGIGTSADNGIVLGSASALRWASTTYWYGARDVGLNRDGVGTIGQRNDTAAMVFRVYNTWSSATNWEAFVIDWQTTANTLRLGTDVGSGGGTARDVKLIRGGVVKETIGADTNAHEQPVKLKSYTVSGLPSASTCGEGSMAWVTDATATTAYSTVAGGGSNKVLVISDGANWIIH